MGRICVLIVAAVLMLAAPGFAQQADGESTEPQEYGKDEFSPFLQDLRRGEIVMLGSFPLTLFLTLEVFDIYRFIDHYGTTDQDKYGFWPYRSPYPEPYKEWEIEVVVGTALSASLLIAVADYIIGKAKQKRPED